MSSSFMSMVTTEHIERRSTKQEEQTFQETDLFHLKMLIVILIHVHIISVLRGLSSKM